jgi:hypothetical protein
MWPCTCVRMGRKGWSILCDGVRCCSTTKQVNPVFSPPFQFRSSLQQNGQVEWIRGLHWGGSCPCDCSDGECRRNTPNRVRGTCKKEPK